MHRRKFDSFIPHTNFFQAVRKIFTVSKEDLLREEVRWKEERAKKKQARSQSSFVGMGGQLFCTFQLNMLNLR